MIYIPEDFLNENYIYYLKDDFYVVKTNENCVNDSCDCFNIHPHMDYMTSTKYSCNPTDLELLDSSKFTDVLSYRLDFDKIVLILFICLFGFIFLLSCLSKYFFRGVFKS